MNDKQTEESLPPSIAAPGRDRPDRNRHGRRSLRRASSIVIHVAEDPVTAADLVAWIYEHQVVGPHHVRTSFSAC